MHRPIPTKPQCAYARRLFAIVRKDGEKTDASHILWKSFHDATDAMKALEMPDALGLYEVKEIT